MITDIAINKPEPFLPEQPLPQFNRSINVHRAIKGLEAGKPILITEFYSNGLALHNELHNHLTKKLTEQDVPRAAGISGGISKAIKSYLYKNFGP